MHDDSVILFVLCLYVMMNIERYVLGLNKNILFFAPLPEKETSVNHKQGFLQLFAIYKLHQFMAGDKGRDIKLLL